jgi:hypothetical protein
MRILGTRITLRSQHMKFFRRPIILGSLAMDSWFLSFAQPFLRVHSSSDPSPTKKWEFRTGELGPLLLPTHELRFSQSRITSHKPGVTEFLLDRNERHKNTCISANSFKTHGKANFYSTRIDNSTRYKQRISGTIDRQIVAKATHSLAAICCAGESDIMAL